MVIMMMLMKCGNPKMDYFHFDCSGGFHTSRILAIMLMLSAYFDFDDCQIRTNTFVSTIILNNYKQTNKQTQANTLFSAIMLNNMKEINVFHHDHFFLISSNNVVFHINAVKLMFFSL